MTARRCDCALLPPESQNRPSADIARKRRSTARLQLYSRVTDRRACVLHATVPSSSGPARKHTAKFEPAAWSWAQMTCGSGAPKRVLSEEQEANHIQTSTAELSI